MRLAHRNEPRKCYCLLTDRDYRLGEKIVTTSTSENKRTLKCSGSMSVTIGSTKASKEVNFTVQQSSDDKITVSVDPFQF
jgi:hypothetical protein